MAHGLVGNMIRLWFHTHVEKKKGSESYYYMGKM